MTQVSVIMPTYDRAHLLGRSIPSVLNQTYQDFELIVVDDGSTDNTRDMVAQFHDERLRYAWHETNRGVSAARNTGVRMATGTYVAFNDSDDEWMAHKLDRQMEVFGTVDAKVGVVYSDMWNIVNGRGERYRAPHIMPKDGIVYDKGLACQTGCYMVTAMVRRQCFEKVGMFDEELRALEDAEFFMRVSKYYHFYHIAEPLVKRFVTAGSLEKNAEGIARAQEHILAKHHQDITREVKVLVYYHVDMAMGLFGSSVSKVASRHIAEGVGRDFPNACRHLLEGVGGDFPETVRVILRAVLTAVSKRGRRVLRAVGKNLDA